MTSNFTYPLIKNSEPVSIDHFIHENSRYKELASFCIAVFIAGYEGC